VLKGVTLGLGLGVQKGLTLGWGLGLLKGHTFGRGLGVLNIFLNIILKHVPKESL
jgi:hypothetical protein